MKKSVHLLVALILLFSFCPMVPIEACEEECDPCYEWDPDEKECRWMCNNGYTCCEDGEGGGECCMSASYCCGNACQQCCSDSQCTSQGAPYCIDYECKQCESDSHCEEPNPKCDTENNTCVQCLSDEDCEEPTPACETEYNTCVECTSDGHCEEPLPVCNTEDYICVECLSDDDCEDPTPACNTENNFCVECLSDEDCEDPTPICETEYNTCVECASDEDCEAPTPACDSESNTCVECTTHDDCEDPTPACELFSHTCVECLDDGDCSAPTPACKFPIFTCVECTEDSHCTDPAEPFCYFEECRECSLDIHCSAPTPVCILGECYGCRTDADCSAPTPACVYNECVECTLDSHCSSPTPYCGPFECVECLENSHCNTDNCYECNNFGCEFSCAEGECCDGDGTCESLGDWSNWTSSVAISVPDDMLDEITNAVNSIPNVNVEVESVTISATGKKKDCCESDGIGVVEDGERYKEATIQLSAELNEIKIWGMPDLHVEKTKCGFKISVDFEAEIELGADFILSATAGKRWEDCIPEECVYGSAAAEVDLSAKGDVEMVLCADTPWTDETCAGVEAEVGASTKINVEVSYNSQDSCEGGFSGGASLQAIVFSADFTLCCGCFEWNINYTYQVYP